MRSIPRLLLGFSAATAAFVSGFPLDSRKTEIRQSNCSTETGLPSLPSSPQTPGKVQKTILSTEGLSPDYPAQKLGTVQVSVRPGLNLTCAIARIQGRRSHMEDEASVVQLQKGTHSSPVVFTLLDGHGGPHCSTFARTHLPAFVAANAQGIINHSRVSSDSDKEASELRAAKHAFRVAFRAFDVAYKEWVDAERGAGRDVSSRDGAAAVCGVIDDAYLHVAWAGDSRAVAWIDPSVWTPKNELESEEGPWVYCITRDHKPQNANEFRRIEKVPGGFVRNDRVCGRLAMSRALGDHYYKDAGDDAAKDAMIAVTDEQEGKTLVICDPDYKRIPIEAVRGVVVASDGLWDVLALSEVMQVLQEHNNPASAADELIRRSHRYAHDNITVLVIYPVLNK